MAIDNMAYAKARYNPGDILQLPTTNKDKILVIKWSFNLLNYVIIQDEKPDYRKVKFITVDNKYVLFSHLSYMPSDVNYPVVGELSKADLDIVKSEIAVYFDLFSENSNIHEIDIMKNEIANLKKDVDYYEQSAEGYRKERDENEARANELKTRINLLENNSCVDENAALKAEIKNLYAVIEVLASGYKRL